MEQQKKQNCFRKNLLPSLMLIGIFCGIAFGYVLRSSRETQWTPREIMYISFVGDIFLRMLKALIIPLLVASVVTSVGSLDLSLSKKIGYRAILWFSVTTLLASTEGILLATIFQPGKNKSWTKSKNPTIRQVLTIDTILDIMRNMFPDNIIKATMSEEHTFLVPPEDNNITDMIQWETVTETIDSSNILGLVTFTIALGIAIGKAGPAGEAILDVFKSLLEVVMLMTTWVIRLSPVGIFFLVSSKILETESFSSIVGQLGPYFLTLLFGLLFHGYVLLPLIYFFCTRKSPIDFLKNNISAIITAFGTSSRPLARRRMAVLKLCNATLPVAMQCIEENCGIDPRISRFIMPMGASISKDGTALYEALAAVYVAQTRNITLSFGSILVIGMVSTISSMGVAGVPHQGIVLLVMMLDSVGLPSQDVSILFIVDWILERFRTAVNVSGDSIGAGVVAHFSVDEMKHLDEMPSTIKSSDQKIS